MRKNLFLVCLVALLMVACTEQNGVDENVVGGWLCTQQQANMQIQVEVPPTISLVMPGVTGIDTTLTIDTVYARPVCYTLTEDKFILVEGDTMATYRYQSGTLYVNVTRMLAEAGIEPVVWAMLGMPIDVPVAFDVQDDRATAKVAIERADTLRIPATITTVEIPFEVNIHSTMNFDRKK